MARKSTHPAAPTNTFIIYCRVSTDGQERDGTSLDTQEAACNQHVAAGGGTVVAVVRDSYSGATLERPGLERARAMLHDGQAAVLLVYAVDRLTRNQAHLGVLMDDADRHGYRLATVTEEIEATAIGRFVALSRAFVGEMEREKIRERTVRGKRGRVQSGKVHGFGPELYGYRRDKSAGVRHIHEAEAVIVRDLFGWAAAGTPVREIVRRLNTRGVPSPATGKTELGRQTWWGKAQVARMLRDATYKGDGAAFRWRKHGPQSPELRPVSEWLHLPAGVVPPIVDAAVWERVQERLDANTGQAGRNAVLPFLLRGMVRCAACGRAMYADRDRRWRYYRCSSRQTPAGRCGATPVNAAWLEAELWAGLSARLNDRALWAAELAAASGEQPQPANGERERLTAELGRTERQIARMMAQMGSLDETLWPDAQRELNRLAGQRRDLVAAVAALDAEAAQQRAAAVSLTVLDTWLSALGPVLDGLDFAGQRTILEGLRLTVTAQGQTWMARGVIGAPYRTSPEAGLNASTSKLADSGSISFTIEGQPRVTAWAALARPAGAL